MTTVFDGGPANPIGEITGISIRSFFASAAITGIYASGAPSDKAAAAVEAFAQADEMLAIMNQPIPVAPVQPVVAPEEPVAEAPTETPVEPTA
jgi:hypothetical protein